MKKVLITGGAGYIGSYLMAHMRSTGVQMAGADAKTTSGGLRGARYQELPREWLAARDTVIHLAAHSSVAACEADPEGAMANNATDLIDFARKLNGQTFIFASTGSLYSRNGPRAVYDRSKEIAEKTLLAASEECGFPLHILRFGTVAGVSPVMREDLILNGMTRDAVRRGEITVRNPGAWRPVLFLPDLAWFIGRILASDVKPGLHDLASFQCRIGGWADIVAKATGARIVEAPDTPTYNFAMPILEGPGRLDDVVGQLVEHWRAAS